MDFREELSKCVSAEPAVTDVSLFISLFNTNLTVPEKHSLLDTILAVRNKSILTRYSLRHGVVHAVVNREPR